LLGALLPLFGYNHNRDAYILRGVGRRFGPVLKPDRRVRCEPPRDGVDMRHAGAAQRLA
jgi:hypothetical protein